MSKAGFWTLHGDGRSVKPGDVVAPHERLTWPRTIGIGVQHVVAMFGATFRCSPASPLLLLCSSPAWAPCCS